MFLRLPLFALCLLCLASACLSASAQSAQGPKFSSVPPPKSLPIHQTFSTNDEGWATLGNSASLSIVSKEAAIDGVDSALQMNYDLGTGRTAAFILPFGIEAGVLSGARSFHFKVRSDYAAKLYFFLQEKNGGRYVAAFSVSKDAWQTVELAPSDFVLSEGVEEHSDPDNKLDLDLVQAAGFIDASILFAQTDDKGLYGPYNGSHHLYLADFQIAETPLPGANHVADYDSIDDFVHPQLDWFVFGVEHAEVAHRGPLPNRGMIVQYLQASGKTVNLSRDIERGKLAGASKLSLTIGSAQKATLLLQIDDKKGNRFSVTIAAPLDTVNPRTLSIPLTAFALAKSNKDQSAKLDLSQIDRIELIDVTGALKNVSPAVENTLHIGDLRAVR